MVGLNENVKKYNDITEYMKDIRKMLNIIKNTSDLFGKIIEIGKLYNILLTEIGINYINTDQHLKNTIKRKKTEITTGIKNFIKNPNNQDLSECKKAKCIKILNTIYDLNKVI